MLLTCRSIGQVSDSSAGGTEPYTFFGFTSFTTPYSTSSANYHIEHIASLATAVQQLNYLWYFMPIHGLLCYAVIFLRESYVSQYFYVNFCHSVTLNIYCKCLHSTLYLYTGDSIYCTLYSSIYCITCSYRVHGLTMLNSVSTLNCSYTSVYISIICYV